MESPKDVSKQPRWGRRVLLGLVAIISLMVAWHLYLSNELRNRVNALQVADSDSAEEMTVSVNPLTNLVSITIVMPPQLDDDNPFSDLGATLGEAMIQSIGPGFIERELNTHAREQFNVYAMLVPYRVRIATEPASPEVVERIRDERERRREEEARARAMAEAERLEETRAYVTENLSLENVRVAPGERFGRRVEGVFGTIVNHGADSLRKVTVRVYFLDSAGQRIGEKEYSPVLVSDFSFGDNTPLRPGYRKDFGYNVEEDAPSGWDKRIEAEIIRVEFLDK